MGAKLQPATPSERGPQHVLSVEQPVRLKIPTIKMHQVEREIRQAGIPASFQSTLKKEKTRNGVLIQGDQLSIEKEPRHGPARPPGHEAQADELTSPELVSSRTSSPSFRIRRRIVLDRRKSASLRDYPIRKGSRVQHQRSGNSYPNLLYHSRPILLPPPVQQLIP